MAQGSGQVAARVEQSVRLAALALQLGGYDLGEVEGQDGQLSSRRVRRALMSLSGPVQVPRPVPTTLPMRGLLS